MPVLYNGTHHVDSSICSVTKLYKPGRRGKCRYIDVIESATNEAAEPVLDLHSSIVMNWISADVLFMAYPGLTFDGYSLENY